MALNEDTEKAARLTLSKIFKGLERTYGPEFDQDSFRTLADEIPWEWER